MLLGTTLLTLSAFIGNALASSVASNVVEGWYWTVEDFSRDCTTYPGSCAYNFTINSYSDYPDAHCFINDTSTNPRFASLDSIPCAKEYDGIWTISWGYNSGGDFAVMTVVRVKAQYDAWFGYNNVANTTDFPDVGPNKVYQLGIFT